MDAQSAKTWLQGASALLIVFGHVAALGAHPVTSGVSGVLVDMMFWPVDGFPRLDAPPSRLMSAISGGVMTGWGVMLWLMATRLLPHSPELARDLILPSVWTWFVIDSAGSIAAGAPLNAVINLAFLLLIAWPLRRSGS